MLGRKGLVQPVWREGNEHISTPILVWLSNVGGQTKKKSPGGQRDAVFQRKGRRRRNWLFTFLGKEKKGIRDTGSTKRGCFKVGKKREELKGVISVGGLGGCGVWFGFGQGIGGGDKSIPGGQ